MKEIEASLKRFPVVLISAGDDLLIQGEKTDFLYFLLEGEVSVIKDGFEVTHRSGPGSVYGEMSVMLDRAHSATVKCITDSKFYCVENPKKYLETNPDIIWHIVKVLCTRLANLNEYLVDMKVRYEGESKQPLSAEERSAGREKMLNDILKTLQV